MASPTKSQAFREEGNKFYRQTQNVGLPPVIQSERLKKAMVCYRQALDTSVNNIEKSSALKNMALTSMKLFTILPYVGEHTSLTDYYLKEGIKSTDLALNLGQSGGQTQQWSNALYERYMESIELVFRHLSTKKTKDRCNALQEIASTVNNKQVKSNILRETARVYFNSSVIALEAEDYKMCLSLLRDCHRPLEEAKLCNTDLSSEARSSNGTGSSNGAGSFESSSFFNDDSGSSSSKNYISDSREKSSITVENKIKKESSDCDTKDEKCQSGECSEKLKKIEDDIKATPIQKNQVGALCNKVKGENLERETKRQKLENLKSDNDDGDDDEEDDDEDDDDEDDYHHGCACEDDADYGNFSDNNYCDEDEDEEEWEEVEEESEEVDDSDEDDAHWSSTNDTDMEDITDLETSVFIQQCRAESLQARELGDSLLKQSIRDSENLNMDAVYTVIDFYKKAILLTKEIEVEMEAIALSRLGNLYDCILKDQTRAKHNFMRSLQLAGSLHPRVFHHDEWFKLAANATARYQNEIVEKEEQERAKERAPYLTELKKELEEIKKHEEKGAIPLLKYIYKTWPPKDKKNKLTEPTTDPSNQKQALKKAIVHYHPDKQDVKLHGMKWFVLAEEITKILTRKYEYFKG